MGGHEYWITSIEFSPDSTRFLSASPGDDEKVKLWNSQTGELVYELPIEASCAVFSFSGNWIYALGHQDVLQFETATGQLVKKTPWKNGDSKALTISRDGRYVIVSHRMNNDQTIITKRLDLENDSSVVLPGPSKPPNAVVISDNNQWIAASYYDDIRIRLWDLRDPNQTKFILEGHNDRVQSIAISPDSRFLVSTSWDESAVVWDLLTRQALGKLEGHTEHVNSCAFSPTGFQVATGASGKTDCSVIVWSIEDILFPEKAKKITADQFPAAWASLGSTLPKPALTAVNDLRNSAGEVLPLLSEKLGTDSQSTSQERIQELIGDLGSEEYAVREEATRQLIEALGQAEQRLREAMETATSTEVRFRIMNILHHDIIRPPINLTSLRQLYRGIFLLELLAIDSDQKEIALSMLESISANHHHIDVAREAGAALKRAKSAAVRSRGN
jgi:WD40 repeat protein